MILVLSIILLLLCLLVGGSRGFKAFIVFFVDILFCLLNIFLIGSGFPIIITTFILCIILAYIILYFVNEYNKKTVASFISTVVILIILMFIVYIFISLSHVQGFGVEYIEEIGWCSYSIDLNLVYATISSVIIGLIGSIVDTSTAISTAVYEVYDKNSHLTIQELLKSGHTIGKDVIATVTNTLLFAFLGGFLTLMIWFSYFDYTILQVINNKVFVLQFLSIMFNALGSLLIIPITNLITCFLLTKNNNLFIKKLEDRIESRKY